MNRHRTESFQFITRYQWLFQFEVRLIFSGRIAYKAQAWRWNIELLEMLFSTYTHIQGFAFPPFKGPFLIWWPDFRNLLSLIFKIFLWLNNMLHIVQLICSAELLKYCFFIHLPGSYTPWPLRSPTPEAPRASCVTVMISHYSARLIYLLFSEKQQLSHSCHFHPAEHERPCSLIDSLIWHKH